MNAKQLEQHIKDNYYALSEAVKATGYSSTWIGSMCLKGRISYIEPFRQHRFYSKKDINQLVVDNVKH